jgi:hypothetical protein
MKSTHELESTKGEISQIGKESEKARDMHSLPGEYKGRDMSKHGK